MASQKRSNRVPISKATTYPSRTSVVGPPSSSDIDNHILVPGPKLRRLFGISAVSLWRWRNDEHLGFPQAKVINGRLYFRWDEVQAWLAKQQSAS